MLTRAKRRSALSMTSLIDVIFLLLLFFMLSSTFSRFGEIKLTLGGQSGQEAIQTETQMILLRLTEDGLSLNGVTLALNTATARIREQMQGKPAHLLISIGTAATSQDLVALMHQLRSIAQAQVTVLQ